MIFFNQDKQLDELGMEVLAKTWEQFPELARNQIALTWLVYDPPVIVNTGGAISAEEFWKHSGRGFSYRGVERIYPASVVKLFYLVAIQEWLEKGMVVSSSELERAIADMIIASSNDATSLVVDILTGTTSGPELAESPFKTWQYQRNIVNRYLQSWRWEELQTINVNQKTWCDGAYGRERAFVGELMENRNMLTTNASARLLHSIIGGVAVSGARSQQMLTFLQRDHALAQMSSNDSDNQISGFLGEGLPPEAQLWSKAGWTSQVRHDCAYIELRNLSPYLLVVFTEGEKVSQNQKILPFISRNIADAIARLS